MIHESEAGKGIVRPEARKMPDMCRKRAIPGARSMHHAAVMRC